MRCAGAANKRPSSRGSLTRRSLTPATHRADHLDGHLRVRPAPVRRVHPDHEAGDILGHEFMGEVVEVGREVQNLKKGDRVVVPFTIACGELLLLQAGSCTRCATTRTPTPRSPRSCTATRPAGLFGYSHMMGGYAGGQAEYVRVPFADVGADQDARRPDRRAGAVPVRHLPDRATWRPRTADIQPGDTVAVWGCGPVGQFAIRSAFLLGAERVIAIDRVPERLQMAREQGKARDDQLRRGDVLDALHDMTGGRGPGRLHRRGRAGGPRRRPFDALLRRGQGDAVHGDRPADGAPAGDPGLPQGRDGVASPACTAGCWTSSRSGRRSPRD